jgi:CheY-like chemotaxis protein
MMRYEKQFTCQLKQVLSRLYDFPYLQNHPFATWFSASRQPGVSRSQFLRQIVVEAIEALNPGPRFSPHSLEARGYQILVQRFVEGKSPAEVADDLGVVERQFYRAQREALEALASLLWEQRDPDAAPAEREVVEADDALALEVERVDGASERGFWDLGEVLRDAFGLACRLEGALPLVDELHLNAPEEPLIVNTSRTLLRHAILQLLGGLFSHQELRGVTMSAREAEEQVVVDICVTTPSPKDLLVHMEAPLQIVAQMLHPLGAEVQAGPAEGEQLRLTISLPLNRQTILVIEDNQDAIQLFERYLTDRRCRVVGVANGGEGLQLARHLRPLAILLDLMMPDQDGWEILQNLKADAATADIPVVVCSVLAQESLAQALGADAYLRKPVSREQLLVVLDPLLAAWGSPTAQ